MTTQTEDGIWIHRLPAADVAARTAELERRGPAGLPLYGRRFAVKDNIDVAGLPTSAACAEFAYVAKETAPVVQRLLDAGAILAGKTNLDQFATGLVGVRSPYGVPRNPFHPAYIPGGSSSGSAVAVAAGLVRFSLGTDTAGSGRVPAAFNNLVGVKPTKGLLSFRGAVPACRSLDCLSIFAANVADAAAVLDVARGYDPQDPFSRCEPPSTRAMPRSLRDCTFGVPRADQLQFFGNPETPGLFESFLKRIESLGARRIEIDFAPFLEAARLLYEGPWVAERYAAIRPFIDAKPDAVLPVVRSIIGGATKYSAADTFAAYYRLKALARRAQAAWDRADIVVTPTAGTIYTRAEIEADPIRLNSNLGYYTNFVNLLDLCAVAVPAGFQSNGLPFGATLLAPAFSDDALLVLASSVLNESIPEKNDAKTLLLGVCGAHMSGLPLNYQLTERGARLVGSTRTAPAYRLYALTEFQPARPGMVRATEGGAAIEVELWEMPLAQFGSFLAGIPAPLGIGTVELEDGTRVKGFLCEAYATAGAREITQLGSWRRFAAKKS